MNERDITLAWRPRILPAVVAAWLAYVVVDFLSHAVFLAAWWRATERYWLPPEELLRSIPFGYASFAIYCAAITWLLARLYRQRSSFATGLRFGAISGMIYGVGVVLGVYSALRLPDSALVVWPVSFLAASSGAGAAAGWVLAAERPWRRVGLVSGAAVLLFIVGVVVQNVFFPTPTARIFP